ncbi:hypothetical protein HBR95_06215 [Pseudomonas panacis]|uniref:hypothetical protein n=1 Tax=Pseudomonas marginalis TaxID=298 RepID=UPI00147370A3|nr:hypothetical protein [Pseudomonas marginalis]NMZ91103.1 hypothetical protein [Pseudomonas marginalis]
MTPYKAPLEGPRAQLKSELSTHASYNEWLSVSVSTDHECLQGRVGAPSKETALFSVHSSTSRPDGYVDIAADQPLHLIVSGLASAGRRCVIEFNTQFAAQGRYLLKGGIADADSGWCRVKVINADTGAALAEFETPTQVTPDPTESPSWRQFMARQGCFLAPAEH